MWNEIDREALQREEYAWRPDPWSVEEIEQVVIMERLHRYNHGLPCGAVALRVRLREHYNVRPLPSAGWIGRVLTRYGLTHGRTGWYEGEDPDWLPKSAWLPPEKRAYIDWRPPRTEGNGSDGQP